MQKLALLRCDWLPRLQASTSAERHDIVRLLRKAINSRKRTADLEALIAELGLAGEAGDPA